MLCKSLLHIAIVTWHQTRLSHASFGYRSATTKTTSLTRHPPSPFHRTVLPPPAGCWVAQAHTCPAPCSSWRAPWTWSAAWRRTGTCTQVAHSPGCTSHRTCPLARSLVRGGSQCHREHPPCTPLVSSPH